MTLINTTTMTYKYNPKGCPEIRQKVWRSFRNEKIDSNVRMLIIACKESQPEELNYIFRGTGKSYAVVKCTNNNVYLIKLGMFELKIVREGYTRGRLVDLCDHMQQCWSMLGI